MGKCVYSPQICVSVNVKDLERTHLSLGGTFNTESGATSSLIMTNFTNLQAKKKDLDPIKPLTRCLETVQQSLQENNK